ncbi:MAG: hypothetical protein AAF399_22470 [Bacteroidota bacterium]
MIANAQGHGEGVSPKNIESDEINQRIIFLFPQQKKINRISALHSIPNHLRWGRISFYHVGKRKNSP